MNTQFWTKLTADEFYAKGGFSNPKLVRTSNGNGGWTHWEEKPYKLKNNKEKK